MASIKRERPGEHEPDAKKPKLASVSDASELKGQHPVALNPADCDLGTSLLSSRALFSFFMAFLFYSFAFFSPM